MTKSDSQSFRKCMIGIGVLLIITLPFLYSAIVVPLSAFEQAQVSIALIAFAMLASVSRAMRPLIIFLSCFTSMRYFYWRISATINLDSGLDGTISILLLAAEVYGLIVLFLGYVQTIEAPKRIPPPITKPVSVDIFIPTYNEAVDIVRRTVIGALAIDYPLKQIYVLDDGKRADIAAMAADLGCHYVTRPDNAGAKAGNLNHALRRTSGDLIAVFDADHVPVRSFLNKTVGFFENSAVALVQTAHHFFNPDPFERNLNLTGRVAPEQHFFFHVIQPGNDFWNSALFCGSCAVLRRSALEEIGGFKTSTVTEDAHTSLELHARGYRSVYLPLALAAGLATETFAAHVKQRNRWARGMAQILRMDCPLIKPGLSIAQRLNYFNAMLHFFFGFPRLMMVLAPLTFLLLGAHPIKADVLSVIAYILPHIALSTIANAMISKNFRHSFWAGVYEISIAPYTAAVTILALLSPRSGTFQVTDKGTNVDDARFDLSTSFVTVILLALSVVALMFAFPARLVAFNLGATDPAELDSILINSAWALANVFVLIASAFVGYEQPQQRRSPRVPRTFACDLKTRQADLACRTLDISETGIRIRLDPEAAVPTHGEISIRNDTGLQGRFLAERVWCDTNPKRGTTAGFAFVQLNDNQSRQLVELIFTGDDSWTQHAYPKDRVFRSFWYLVTTFWRASRGRTKIMQQGLQEQE